MSGKSRAEILAASAAFLERTMEDERAEIIERLCQSAAPCCGYENGPSFDFPPEIAARADERADRIDLFATDYEMNFGSTVMHTNTVSAANVARFPDLYGDWVYQPDPLIDFTSPIGWVHRVVMHYDGPPILDADATEVHA